MKAYESKSPEATEQLGNILMQKALQKPREHALVFELHGALGSGKTTFTKGVIKALGIRGKVVSPTFTLMRRFKLPQKRGSLYHIDLYRLPRVKAIKILELEKIVADPGNVVVIEWPEHARRILPKSTVQVFLQHRKGFEDRIVKVNFSSNK